MKLFLASAVAGLAIAVGAFPQSTGVQVGDQVQYEFQRDFLGGIGPASISELEGAPTLIDFWGTR